MIDESFQPSQRARRAAEAMLVRSRRAGLDDAAATVIEELASAGIDSLLLRGPVFARLLYDDDEIRPYTDCDILVPADRYSDAEAVIAATGYSPGPRPDGAGAGDWHALTWKREDGSIALDVHRTLIGARASPMDVWRALAANADSMVIGDATVRVPSPAGIAVVVSLHVAEHGPRWTKPHEDLRRAIERVARTDWAAAADMARQIGAGGAMRAGLSRVPNGADVADELGLPAADTEALLHANAADGMAINLERLAQARGLRGKAIALRRSLWPTPAAMPVRHRLARRGRLGLYLAYLVRPLVLLARFPRNLREWVRVRWVNRR